MKWGVQARFSPIPVNTWSLWLVPVGGYIGPIGKVHFAPLGNRDGGARPLLERYILYPRDAQGSAGWLRAGQGRCWLRRDGGRRRWRREQGCSAAMAGPWQEVKASAARVSAGTVAPAGCPTLAAPAAKAAGKTWASYTSWPWCASVVQDAAAEARQPDRHRKGRQGSAAPGQAVSAVRWIPD